MSEKLVLIDGHSILNRAFYGLPDLTNSEGLHTNAVYGFLNILFKILEEEKPQYLAVAFDISAPTFRHKMFDGYKGTRKPPLPEFRQQVPLMKEVLDTMGVCRMELEGYEADDLLGTMAKRAEEQGLIVSVVSGDRDLLQLATEKIRIRIPKTKGGQTNVEDYFAEDVKALYQVTPKEFIDVKALMGDASDNIPGIPGVGEKTAGKIIAEYHSIENAYAHVDEIKPNKAKLSLQEHYEQAVMSKELATIETNVPMDITFEQCRLGDLYTEQAYEMFARLEFKNFLGRFQEQETIGQVEETFLQVTELPAAQKLIQQALKATIVGIQLMEEGGQIKGLALSFDDCTAALLCKEDEPVQMELFPTEESKTQDTDLTADYLLQMLQQLVDQVPQIATFQAKQLMKHITISSTEKIFDVTVAEYLLNPLKSNYPYDELAKEYLGMMVYQKEDTLQRQSSFEAYVAGKVVPLQKKALMDTGMYDLYMQVEMPLIPVLYSMEREGILADRGALKEYGDKLQVRILELEKQIYEQAGETFNINSPKQLGVILFEKLGMPGGKKTKTGYSTAAGVLEKLAPEQPIITDILEYRQLTKLKSTYADGLANCIGNDGKIHTTFQQTITATGRLSSTDPNLQNIPMRMELGRLIRKCFTAREGYVFVDADYSQIELRVLAHMSGDENLIQAYQEAEDIHRITASKVFHVPFEEVTDLQRRNAKAVNFGIVYGISSFGLGRDLSISPKEASVYIKQYFQTYPKIKEFLDKQVELGKEQGYVTTMFGRRRPIPELTSTNFMQRSFGERIAMNSPIQGTAADIIKIAMNRVFYRLQKEQLESKLILQVHDELLVEAKEQEVEQVKAILEEEMQKAADLAVNLEIDMHTGKDWYDAK